MRSVDVEVAQPSRLGGRPLVRTLERVGTDPFAQRCLDEALRLAVGARRVGPGALVRDGVGLRVADADLRFRNVRYRAR